MIRRCAFEAANLEHEKELKEAENRLTELKRKQQQVEHELSECKVTHLILQSPSAYLSISVTTRLFYTPVFMSVCLSSSLSPLFSIYCLLRLRFLSRCFVHFFS